MVLRSSLRSNFSYLEMSQKCFLSKISTTRQIQQSNHVKARAPQRKSSITSSYQNISVWKLNTASSTLSSTSLWICIQNGYIIWLPKPNAHLQHHLMPDVLGCPWFDLCPPDAMYRTNKQHLQSFQPLHNNNHKCIRVRAANETTSTHAVARRGFILELEVWVRPDDLMWTSSFVICPHLSDSQLLNNGRFKVQLITFYFTAAAWSCELYRWTLLNKSSTVSVNPLLCLVKFYGQTTHMNMKLFQQSIRGYEYVYIW